MKKTSSSLKRRHLAERTTETVAAAETESTSRFTTAERFGWAGLAIIAIYFLAISWRKWPDPLVDFGRELYLPWRLSQGALLYRDADDFFGPLSQYFNAALFSVFGPGMMVLVIANLVIFAAIVITLYILFRKAWGVGAALLAAGLFISVFGFSQYVGMSNYNYATPYSHEATHGILVCVLLVLVLCRWVEEPSRLRTALAGGLFGLTAVLKPEILFGAVVVSAAALALRWRSGKSISWSLPAVWAGSAAAPTVAFGLYFSAHVPWREAWPLAARAWVYAAAIRHGGGPVQDNFFGWNRLWENAANHAISTVIAVVVIGGIAGIAWLADRSAHWWKRYSLTGMLAASALWFANFEVDWMNSGRCLLGLTCIYILSRILPLLRRSRALDEVETWRLLPALLAASLMARMVLNGRIYQYGFYQAALAGILIPAVVIGELPARLALGRWGRNLTILGCLLLVVPAASILADRSQDLLSLKTYAIGQGRDQFYAFDPNQDPISAIVRAMTDRLDQGSPGDTLMVLPEGEMINYLARRRSPVAPFFFYSAVTNHGREQVLVDELGKRPPTWVAIVTRDLREYGIERYGEAPGKGEQLLRWVSEHYETEFKLGGDPLSPDGFGGVLLKLKKATVSKPGNDQQEEHGHGQ